MNSRVKFTAFIDIKLVSYQKLFRTNHWDLFLVYVYKIIYTGHYLGYLYN